MNFLIAAVTIFLFLPTYHTFHNDYYWREYLGSVSSDAFIAGEDLDGNNVYVGQVYIRDAGLVIGGITAGATQMAAPYGGVAHVGRYIKVLCGSQKNFYWLQANATNLHVQIQDQHPVIGGHDDVYGYLNIGRISVGGATKIGKIASFWVERAQFFFADNGTEKVVNSYEILMYRNSTENEVAKFRK